jgi:hypothetical protein
MKFKKGKLYTTRITFWDDSQRSEIWTYLGNKKWLLPNSKIWYYPKCVCTGFIWDCPDYKEELYPELHVIEITICTEEVQAEAL